MVRRVQTVRRRRDGSVTTRLVLEPVTTRSAYGRRGTGGTSLGSGTSSLTFDEDITGLTSGTTYYFCGIAQNSVGTSFGTVLSFTTASSADISITKVDSQDPVTVGNNLTYTITVTNGGPQGATNVEVTDTIPGNTTFVSSSASQGSCTGTSTVTCNLGSIANAGTATVTITVSVDSGSSMSNTATVTATEVDRVSGNNSDTETTNIAAAVCTTAPLNMVAWYKGENNGNDQFGVYNGTVTGATYPGGKVGQAFSLDGIDDKVVVSSVAALQPAAITIDAWIYVDPTATGEQGIIGKYVSNGGDRGYELYIEANKKLTLRANTVNPISFSSINALVFGQWNHIAATISSSASVI